MQENWDPWFDAEYEPRLSEEAHTALVIVIALVLTVGIGALIGVVLMNQLMLSGA